MGEMIKSKILKHPIMLLSWLATQLRDWLGFIKGSFEAFGSIITNANYTPDFLHQTSFHWPIICHRSPSQLTLCKGWGRTHKSLTTIHTYGQFRVVFELLEESRVPRGIPRSYRENMHTTHRRTPACQQTEPSCYVVTLLTTAPA